MENNTDSQNMKDFYVAGWKILPHNPTRYITGEIHVQLLSESMEQYGYIWREMSGK